MEGDDQRRRQYEQSSYSRGYAPDYGASGANVSNLQHLRGAQIAENADRYRHGQVLTTRTSTSSSLTAGAGPSHDLGALGYSQGQQYQTSQLQASTFQYQPDYSHEPQRQRFSQYPSHMMYNAPQQPQSQSPYNIPQQGHNQSSYEPVGHYQPRQATAGEVLSSQLGVPPPYYSGGDNPGMNAPPAMPQAYQAAPYQQGLQYDQSTTLGQSTLASSYPTMPSGVGGLGVSGEQSQASLVDTAANNNNRFYRAIGETNDRTSKGMLTQAGSSLLQITEWLLTNVVHLGIL